MDYALVAVLGVVVVVVTAAFSRKLGVAAPLLLVLVGIGYSFIPGVPEIEIEPDLILMGVLPPLLYAAAITVPVVDFRRNFASISALSVLLVVVSALVTGFVLFTVLPDLNLGAAIALGAVISPTDVVAATAIAKRLGLPPRLLSILEGEGLVNDATALVMLRTAIAAAGVAASGEFNGWTVVGDFLYAVIVALAIGLVVGVVSVFIRRKLDEPILDTAISFAVPFIAYIPAEELHACGGPLQRTPQRALQSAVPHLGALQLAHPAVRPGERRLPADGSPARRHRGGRPRGGTARPPRGAARAAGHRHPDGPAVPVRLAAHARGAPRGAARDLAVRAPERHDRSLPSRRPWRSRRR
jgi:hypothetical protein